MKLFLLLLMFYENSTYIESYNQRFLNIRDTIQKYQDIKKKKLPNKKRPRHIAKLHVYNLPDDQFYDYMRIKREVFNELVNTLAPHFCSPRLSNEDSKLEPWRIVAMCIRYLQGGATRDILHWFAVHKSTFCKYFWEFVRIVPIAPKAVKWYQTQEEMELSARKFRDISEMSRCIGAVDGIVIKIQCPNTRDCENPRSYFCRKGFYGLNVQAVCDANKQFVYFDTSFSGSCCDSPAFKSSRLNRKFEEESFKEYFLVGDAAYPLRPYLLTPYKSLNTDDDEYRRKKNFNNHLQTARQCIECAFGILVRRFQILHRPLANKFVELPRLLMCLAHLHNFILSHQEWQIEYEDDPNTVEILNTIQTVIAGREEEFFENRREDSTIEGEQIRTGLSNDFNRCQHYLTTQELGEN